MKALYFAFYWQRKVTESYKMKLKAANKKYKKLQQEFRNVAGEKFD